MPTISTYVDVDFDLHDIDSEDLTDELEARGFTVIDKEEAVKNDIPIYYKSNGDPMGSLVEELYHAYTTKQQEVTEQLLKQLFYTTIGRIA